jgi:hypothetical protein
LGDSEGVHQEVGDRAGDGENTNLPPKADQGKFEILNSIDITF